MIHANLHLIGSTNDPPNYQRNPHGSLSSCWSDHNQICAGWLFGPWVGIFHPLLKDTCIYTQFFTAFPFFIWNSRLRVIAELRHGDIFHSANIVSRWVCLFENAFSIYVMYYSIISLQLHFQRVKLKFCSSTVSSNGLWFSNPQSLLSLFIKKSVTFPQYNMHNQIYNTILVLIVLMIYSSVVLQIS